MISEFRFTFLGTGTSGGVPELGCECPVCRSEDLRNRRTRTAGLLQLEGKNYLIDCGPDIRQQLLRHHIQRIDGVFFTHAHADHIFGLDDLRALSFRNGRMTIPLYLHPEHAAQLKRAFSYLFEPPTQVGGGILPVEIRSLDWGNVFSVDGLMVTPVLVMHGKIPVTAFTFEKRLAYVTDASFIPKASRSLLSDFPFLILNALRPRPHPTHFHFSESFSTALSLRSKKTFFVHMNHDVSHEDFQKMAPPTMGPAHDGLQLNLLEDSSSRNDHV